MPRTFLAIVTLAPAIAFIGCESPEAFPYDPDIQTPQTSPAPTSSQAAAPAAAPTAAPTATPTPAPAAPAAKAPSLHSVDPAPLASLQGEWTLVSLLKNEKTITAGESQTGKLIITGKRFVLLGAKEIGNMSAGSLSIDAAQTPKTITLVADPKDADGKARFGIYDFPDSSDFLRIAIPQPGERKPDGFAPAKGISILVFKRTQTPAK
jgi:uncharacterized protein (TIGR03067 family)